MFILSWSQRQRSCNIKVERVQRYLVKLAGQADMNCAQDKYDLVSYVWLFLNSFWYNGHLRRVEWSEKDQNCELQFQQPDYWPRHSPEKTTFQWPKVSRFLVPRYHVTDLISEQVSDFRFGHGKWLFWCEEKQWKCVFLTLKTDLGHRGVTTWALAIVLTFELYWNFSVSLSLHSIKTLKQFNLCSKNLSNNVTENKKYDLSSDWCWRVAKVLWRAPAISESIPRVMADVLL